jgi:rare lipoprotein A
MHFCRRAVSLATFGFTFATLPALSQESVEPASTSAVEIHSTAPASSANVFQGLVSYYASAFAGRLTSNGERYVPDRLTMAHRTLKFGTLVRVTNLQNNLSVVVRVNDRGPFTSDRVGDVSAGAARLIGMLHAGVVQARFEVLGSGEAQAGK